MAAPTEAEVLEALIEYADYESADSIERARLFQTAARRWQLMRPVSSGDAGSTMAWDAAATASAIERVNAFIAAKLTATGRVRHLTPGRWRK